LCFLVYICVVKEKNRIRVTGKLDIDLSKNANILSMLDKMRERETVDGVTRASMVRIAIVEAFRKRKLVL
jgi:hypothetical protein